MMMTRNNDHQATHTLTANCILKPNKNVNEHIVTAPPPHLDGREDKRHFQPPTICTAIRCTIPNCNCECFVPGKRHLRYCETCKHGWVPHD